MRHGQTYVSKCSTVGIYGGFLLLSGELRGRGCGRSDSLEGCVDKYVRDFVHRDNLMVGKWVCPNNLLISDQ